MAWTTVMLAVGAMVSRPTAAQAGHSSFSTTIIDAATARPLRQESSTVLLTPRDGGDHTLLSRNVTTYVWRPM